MQIKRKIGIKAVKNCGYMRFFDTIYCYIKICEKIFKKSFKKVLTKGDGYGIIIGRPKEKGVQMYVKSIQNEP